MLCQYCGKRQATTHLKRVINGQTTEFHVCAQCAAQHGLDLFGGFGLNTGDLFGGLFSSPVSRELGESVRCRTCGRSFREIAQSGQLGCPDCYLTFYDQLLPSIQRVHGKATHAGKVGSSGPDESKTERRLESLKSQLNKAIAAQEYEKCAELRDQIRELEGEQHE